MTPKRETDAEIERLLLQPPEQGLRSLISFWKKIVQLRKDGYKIVAYKERITTFEIKPITLITDPIKR